VLSGQVETFNYQSNDVNESAGGVLAKSVPKPKNTNVKED